MNLDLFCWISSLTIHHVMDGQVSVLLKCHPACYERWSRHPPGQRWLFTALVGSLGTSAGVVSLGKCHALEKVMEEKTETAHRVASSHLRKWVFKLPLGNESCCQNSNHWQRSNKIFQQNKTSHQNTVEPHKKKLGYFPCFHWNPGWNPFCWGFLILWFMTKKKSP